jgi:hypothetical protein
MEILIIKKDFSVYQKIHTNLSEDLPEIPFVGEGAQIQLSVKDFVNRYMNTGWSKCPNPLNWGLGDKLNKSLSWFIRDLDNTINLELSRNESLLGTYSYTYTEIGYLICFENFLIPSEELGSVWLTQHSHSHERGHYTFVNLMAHFDCMPYKIGD